MPCAPSSLSDFVPAGMPGRFQCRKHAARCAGMAGRAEAAARHAGLRRAVTSLSSVLAPPGRIRLTPLLVSSAPVTRA